MPSRMQPVPGSSTRTRRSGLLSGVFTLLALLSLSTAGCGPVEGDFWQFDVPPPDYTTPDATLTAADPQIDHYFGYALALGTDLAFVGAYDDDTGSGSSGAVYVYERDAIDPSVWTQIAKIIAPDVEPGDQFGRSVAYEGGVLAVGSWLDDDACVGDPYCNSGAVWLFGQDVGGPSNWGPIAKILPDDLAPRRGFGSAVAIQGATLVVGALGDDGACTADPSCNSGAFYVFDRDQGGADNWGQVQKRVASDSLQRAEFGTAVALDADTVIVGAPYDARSCTPSNSCWYGAAYVFGRDVGGAGAWGEVAKVTPPNLARGDAFGIDVALEGDVMVVGAPGEDVACPQSINCDSGAVHVFERDLGGADAWGQRVRILPDDLWAYQEFGLRVDLSADRIASGAWGDSEAGLYAGATYTFDRDLGGVDSWGQSAKLIAQGGRKGDYQGIDVALLGQTLVVGAIGVDGLCKGCDSGAVYVFTLP